MKILDLIHISFYGIKTHKLRSILTTLGIIIGVGTVISMISIIEGINGFVYKQFGTIGSNVIYIQKYKWRAVIGSMDRNWLKKVKDYPDFNEEDVKEIKKLYFVDNVSISIDLLNISKVEYKNKTLENVELTGATPEIFEILGYEVERGRKLNEDDEFYRRNVCVVGKYVVSNLFEYEDPLDKEIKIGDRNFLIVGILKERGEIFGYSLDRIIIIPFSKGKEMKGIPIFDWQEVFIAPVIEVKIKDNIEIEKGIEELRKFLRKRRALFFTDEDNFYFNTQESLLQIYRSITGGIFAAMIGIASLALIVGGIGIMNIMLVSVSERTKEIGIRMAVGARRRDILYQFLLETILLTSIGSFLGLLLGIVIGKLVDILTPLPSRIPLWSIFIALLLSFVVGLFFGIYPATQAAKKDPIECLRYE
ncbi:MAG: ABC transporter permease [Candidatus Hydrothermales bacterium]